MTARQLTAAAKQIAAKLPITEGKAHKHLVSVAREMIRKGNDPEQVRDWLNVIVLAMMAEYGE